MIRKLTNINLLPGWLCFAIGIGCIWGFLAMQSLADQKAQKLPILESGLLNVNCPAVNIENILAIARTSVDNLNTIASLCKSAGVTFFAIGALNFILIFKTFGLGRNPEGKPGN